jgi:hypothetical protein
MNDTGSNVQTIFPTDLAALGYDQLTYQGLLGPLCIETANGVVRMGRRLHHGLEKMQ